MFTGNFFAGTYFPQNYFAKFGADISDLTQSPFARTAFILAELRGIIIPQENRTTLISKEDRSIEVKK